MSIPANNPVFPATTGFTFDKAFAAALRAVINTIAAEPSNSPADLLDELDCAVTSLTLTTLGRQA